MDLMQQAVDYYLDLIKQGKRSSEALDHVWLRYGVSRESLKSEVVRQRSYPLCERQSAAAEKAAVARMLGVTEDDVDRVASDEPAYSRPGADAQERM